MRRFSTMSRTYFLAIAITDRASVRLSRRESSVKIGKPEKWVYRFAVLGNRNGC
jgi:hypothetical protein